MYPAYQNIIIQIHKSYIQMKILACFLIFITITLAAPAADGVSTLKGYYNFQGQFKMYSGYLTIQQTPLINVHYLFVTSKNKPQTDDVVLWLNGGPGCSSLLGFLQQLGPHLLNQGSDKLSQSKNPHSWNNNANLLFFESPPGVGFSINNDSSYKYSDTRTATDNLLALKAWYQKFPEFAPNKFWISGQSYCGMYIPLFADQILKNKNNIIPSASINFQGILIGNGVMLTELHWRRQARNTFYSRHYFYGPEILGLISNCKYNSEDDNNMVCNLGNRLADQSTKRINPYNAIGICYVSTTSSNEKPRRRFWYSAFDQQMYNMIEDGDEPGCSSDEGGISNYFNDKEVQSQLNVKQTKWSSCSDYIGSNFKKDLTTIHLFQGFKSAGLKILLYSGNVDAQVSYVQTEQYIKKIGWPIVQEKRAIKNERGSLQAWVTQYDGLTFYVVNAAGHMVPSDKPHAALRMFDYFRTGKF